MDRDPHASRRSRPASPLTAFVRFAVCGGAVGLCSSAAVALLAALMPWMAANALVTVASTVLATELHARLTFRDGRRCGLRRHAQSAGTAAAAYVVTSAAMALLHLVQAAPGVWREQLVYLSASALAGIGRFAVLRLFVFSGTRTRTPPAAPGYDSGAAELPPSRSSMTVMAPEGQMSAA
ncbi:GtrA family protein [Streptomyces lunaelactis]|uniref:GtrA family protein n=1 Tax=Streptomyces lunaelactis TaxID=1535768 RepID=UPI0020C82CF7|nr:GtrA family protein [Streptomyces lunaelactis]